MFIYPDLDLQLEVSCWYKRQVENHILEDYTWFVEIGNENEVSDFAYGLNYSWGIRRRHWIENPYSDLKLRNGKWLDMNVEIENQA